MGKNKKKGTEKRKQKKSKGELKRPEMEFDFMGRGKTLYKKIQI